MATTATTQAGMSKNLVILSSRRRALTATLKSTPFNLSTAVKGVYLPPFPSQLNVKNNLKQQTEVQVVKHVPGENELLLKLYSIAEAAGDRAEMHDIIGEQRNNWNILLLNSVNALTLTASLMAGIASMPIESVAAHFKISSALLYMASTGIMAISGKIQPAQLAEEQRKATQLFKELERSIYNTLAISKTPTQEDVQVAMERLMAIDEAYPLPLLPGMLEKFPENVQPAVWWPRKQRRSIKNNAIDEKNGWNKEMEEEMKGILNVLKLKDEEQYVRLGKLVMKMNKTMAISAPLLACAAAVGTTLIGFEALGQGPALTGVVGGVLAAIVYNLEHAGQVGMVFELFRNCAGFYRRLEEEIENNLGEQELENRENGELFEMKMALQLGRSVSELKKFSAYSSSASCQDKEEIPEFAGKLF